MIKNVKNITNNNYKNNNWKYSNCYYSISEDWKEQKKDVGTIRSPPITSSKEWDA